MNSRGMLFWVAVPLAVAVAAISAGCEREVHEQTKGVAEKASEATEKTRTGIDDLRGEASDRGAFLRKAQGELFELDKRLADLDGRVKSLPVPERNELDGLMIDLYAARGNLAAAITAQQGESQLPGLEARTALERSLARVARAQEAVTSKLAALELRTPRGARA